jgi:hypothetical protein
VVAATSLPYHDESCWRLQAAPQGGQVLWGNLRLRLWERRVRAVLAGAAYVVLVIFYVVPVTAVQVLPTAPALCGAGPYSAGKLSCSHTIDYFAREGGLPGRHRMG